MNVLNNFKGLLIDLEGVIYSGEEVIDGSIETIEKLKKKFKIRYLTNTTTTSRNLIFQKLINLNLSVNEEDIFSPSIAINAFLKDKKIKNISLIANEKINSDFKEFNINSNNPDAVIMGDIYKDFNWDKLNNAFELLLKKECLLIALHKNKYCKRNNKIALDLGPFVNALEYASSKNAIVIGKPEKNFFDLAINSLSLNKNETIMIGDDIVSDIEGAKSNNIKAIQVRTGKFQSNDESDNFIQPDYRINSIADLLFL